MDSLFETSTSVTKSAYGRLSAAYTHFKICSELPCENLSKIACQAPKLQIPAPDKGIRVAHELSPILYP